MYTHTQCTQPSRSNTPGCGRLTVDLLQVWAEQNGWPLVISAGIIVIVSWVLSWIQRLSITVLFNCDGRDGACHTFPSPPSSILLCPLPPIPAIHPVLIHHGTSWDNLYPCTTPNVYPVLVYHDTGWDIALYSLQIPFSIPSSCTVGMGWEQWIMHAFHIE